MNREDIIELNNRLFNLNNQPNSQKRFDEIEFILKKVPELIQELLRAWKWKSAFQVMFTRSGYSDLIKYLHEKGLWEEIVEKELLK